MPDSPQPEPPIAEGDFYVPEHECKGCGLPAKAAPDLIRHHASAGGHGSCYFFKQPSTPAEVDQAIAAVNASCVCAVRYGGFDPEILFRIAPQSADQRAAYVKPRPVTTVPAEPLLVAPPSGAWTRLRRRLTRNE